MDRNRQSNARIRAVIKVVPVVISNVKVVAIEPVFCPGFRVGIHEQERNAAVLETGISHVNGWESMHPEPVLIPEIEIKAGLRNVGAAVASTLCPVAMLASPLVSTIPLPCTLPLPRALLLPSPLLLPRDCLLLRTLRLLLLSLWNSLLLWLLFRSLSRLLLLLWSLLLRLLGPLLLLRLLFRSLLRLLPLLWPLLLRLLGPLLLLRLLFRSLLGLLRSLLLRLLGPLLRLLRLFLRVLLFLVLRVHRDQRPEKQKQGSRAIDSNELHGVIVSLT